MRPETSFYYGNEEWKCVYFNGQPGLSVEANEEILWNAINMYKIGTQKRKIVTEEIEGTMMIKGRRSLGSFFGTHVSLKGEFEGGKLELGILLLDRANPEMN